MGFTDRKLEMAIVGLAVVMVGGMGYLLKAPVQAALQSPDVVYEMPRPKRSFLAALFDLGGREISRQYINPFAKKKEEAKKTADAKKASPAAPKAVAQAKTPEKKKEDPKKKVDVQVVGSRDEKVFGDDDGFWAQSGSNPQRNSARAEGKAPADTNAKNTLSGSQWRALVLAQPTSENVAKLVAAYNNKEVDENTFYTIVADLFRNNKSETQALGLTAVKAVYSAKSFALTAQFYDQLTSDLQAQAHNYLLTYAVSGRLPMLMSVLQSNDTEVVAAAAQVVLDGYQKAKEGVTPSADPRTSRGDVTINAVASYSKFVPIFQQLSQSQDSVVAGLANSALSQIQSAVAAL